MTDTPTTRNGFREQSLGSNINLWGAPYLNQFMQRLDESLDGQVTIDCTAASPITLTNTPYVTGQQNVSRYLILTGALTGDVVLLCASVQKWFVVINRTTGSHTVKLQTASLGTQTTLVQNRRTIVFTDGTDTFSTEIRLDLIDAPQANVSLNSQKITNLAVGTAATDAASLTNSLRNFVGVLTGPVTGYPGAASSDFSTLGNTLDQFASPAATVDFNNQFLSDLKDPVLAQDAVNLQTMSAAIAAAGSLTPGTLRVSVTDTTAGYLYGKLTFNGIPGLIQNQAGNESLLLPIAIDLPLIALGVQ